MERWSDGAGDKARALVISPFVRQGKIERVGEPEKGTPKGVLQKRSEGEMGRREFKLRVFSHMRKYGNSQILDGALHGLGIKIRWNWSNGWKRVSQLLMAPSELGIWRYCRFWGEMEKAFGDNGRDLPCAERFLSAGLIFRFMRSLW